MGHEFKNRMNLVLCTSDSKDAKKLLQGLQSFQYKLLFVQSYYHVQVGIVESKANSEPAQTASF